MMTHRTAGCRASFAVSEHLTAKAPYDGAFYAALGFDWGCTCQNQS